MERFVWEPALVKTNALEGASEAACLVLSVDETVTNPSSVSPSWVGCGIQRPR
ncbi:BQ5605_C008g04921 [Microbotryum silenes-dioicae]|uniref:BQ5605_C008g04921 protein n=1 Tax=Microbotryum silenes-dioicae TaxID=796604 RepID=A0A2X0MG73_9BASI|nr:BQ5605_C008g04921 [Microbotryum silenes-dioicae]